MSDTPEVKVAERWPRQGVEVLGTTVLRKAHIVIMGPSGVGKSFLLRQLAIWLQERGRLEDLLVGMAEDSTATYAEGTHIIRVKSIQAMRGIIQGACDASARGMIVPSVVAEDSISGIGDFEWQGVRQNPPVNKAGVPDMLEAYNRLGYDGIDLLKSNRDLAPCTVVAMVTTTPPEKGFPEICFPGKLVPSNFTRLSTATFFMKAERDSRDPETIKGILAGGAKPGPHQSVGIGEDGQPDGMLISRYFYSMSAGEVEAKSHFSLRMKEPAYLPNVLIKMGLIQDSTKEGENVGS